MQRLPVEKLIRGDEGERSRVGDTQFYYKTVPPSNVILEGQKEGVRLAKE